MFLCFVQFMMLGKSTPNNAYSMMKYPISDTIFDVTYFLCGIYYNKVIFMDKHQMKTRVQKCRNLVLKKAIMKT